MSKETEELLAVLDLPKEEQFDWLFKRGIVDDSIARSQVTDKIVPHWCDIELADLAFRLRNEVCKDSLTCDNYITALRIVYRSFCKSQEGTVRQNMIPYDHWLAIFIVPIERIIAALIAKQKEKEDADKN